MVSKLQVFYLTLFLNYKYFEKENSMIQKRNISTFAAVLALMAFILLSASPAKAFKTTNPDMAAAYDQCLTTNYKGSGRKVKKCFEDFRTTYAEACLLYPETINRNEFIPLGRVVDTHCRALVGGR
jgi:hypothetical protein